MSAAVVIAAAATNLHGLSYLPDVWGLHRHVGPAHPAGLAHDAYLPVEGWMEHAAFDTPAFEEDLRHGDRV